MPADGMVNVNSKAYGVHQRRKRGTVKPADVNDSFKAASRMLLTGSRLARLVKNAIDPYRKPIYDGTLWSRMLSQFYRQAKQSGQLDFRAIEGLEMNREHPLVNIMNFRMASSTDMARTMLHVMFNRIQFHFPPSIQGIENAVLEPVVLFVDVTGTSVHAAASPPVSLTLAENQCAFAIGIPENTATVMICLMCKAVVHGQPTNDAGGMGMKIVSVAALHDIAAVSKSGDETDPVQQLSLW